MGWNDAIEAAIDAQKAPITWGLYKIMRANQGATGLVKWEEAAGAKALSRRKRWQLPPNTVISP